MTSVKCDMCGKDITNDTERTVYRFSHEETVSDYDICGECSNKIEEFIKSSEKQTTSKKPEAEPVHSEEVKDDITNKNRKSPLYSDVCFKLTEEEAAEQDELDSIHDTFCEVRKKAIDRILDRACEGKMCNTCSEFHGALDLVAGRYRFTCTKKRITKSIPLTGGTEEIEIRPEDFVKDEEVKKGNT